MSLDAVAVWALSFSAFHVKQIYLDCKTIQRRIWKERSKLWQSEGGSFLYIYIGGLLPLLKNVIQHSLAFLFKIKTYEQMKLCFTSIKQIGFKGIPTGKHSVISVYRKPKPPAKLKISQNNQDVWPTMWSIRMCVNVRVSLFGELYRQ